MKIYRFSKCNCGYTNRLPEVDEISPIIIIPPQKCIKCGQIQTPENSELIYSNSDTIMEEK